MSMGRTGHVEAEYQAGGFVLISSENVAAMKKDNFYADLL